MRFGWSGGPRGAREVDQESVSPCLSAIGHDQPWTIASADRHFRSHGYQTLAGTVGGPPSEPHKKSPVRKRKLDPVVAAYLIQSGSTAALTPDDPPTVALQTNPPIRSIAHLCTNSREAVH